MRPAQGARRWASLGIEPRRKFAVERGNVLAAAGCLFLRFTAVPEVFMRALDYLRKPEYWFRPGQVWRRVVRQWARHAVVEEVRLPWGLPLRIRPAEIIGRAIWQTGLYDLAVSETIARLLKPGDRAIDAGANIGYMSSLMAWRVGAKGQVWSFEPHPELVGELQANVRGWGEAGLAVRVLAKALGETEGEAILVQPPEFAENRGTSSLLGRNQEKSEAERSFAVELTRLDVACNAVERFELLKIDVEGGELAVLRGAAGLLRARRIRHVIFEEHEAYPTPVTQFLKANGYTVFRLVKQLFGLGLLPATERADGPAWAPPSFLATLDPAGARAALGGRGWRVLGG